MGKNIGATATTTTTTTTATRSLAEALRRTVCHYVVVARRESALHRTICLRLADIADAMTCVAFLHEKFLRITLNNNNNNNTHDADARAWTVRMEALLQSLVAGRVWEESLPTRRFGNETRPILEQAATILDRMKHSSSKTSSSPSSSSSSSPPRTAVASPTGNTIEDVTAGLESCHLLLTTAITAVAALATEYANHLLYLKVASYKLTGDVKKYAEVVGTLQQKEKEKEKEEEEEDEDEQAHARAANAEFLVMLQRIDSFAASFVAEAKEYLSPSFRFPPPSQNDNDDDEDDDDDDDVFSDAKIDVTTTTKEATAAQEAKKQQSEEIWEAKYRQMATEKEELLLRVKEAEETMERERTVHAAQLAAMKRDSQRDSSLIEQLERHNQELERQAERHLRDVAREADYVAQLEVDNMELNESLAVLTKESTAAAEEKNARIAELEEAATHLQKRVDDADAENAALRKQLDDAHAVAHSAKTTTEEDTARRARENKAAEALLRQILLLNHHFARLGNQSANEDKKIAAIVAGEIEFLALSHSQKNKNKKKKKDKKKKNNIDGNHNGVDSHDNSDDDDDDDDDENDSDSDSDSDENDGHTDDDDGVPTTEDINTLNQRINSATFLCKELLQIKEQNEDGHRLSRPGGRIAERRGSRSGKNRSDDPTTIAQRHAWETTTEQKLVSSLALFQKEFSAFKVSAAAFARGRSKYMALLRSVLAILADYQTTNDHTTDAFCMEIAQSLAALSDSVAALLRVGSST